LLLLLLLGFADGVDGALEGAVLLLELAEGEAEAEEGGCPFADEDAPPVGAGEVAWGPGSAFKLVTQVATDSPMDAMAAR
jgi:hypothetical protein